MLIKTYSEFVKEELGFKDAVLGTVMSLSPFQSIQAKSQTPTTQSQQQTVLSHVSFSRSQAIDNSPMMLDNVHGALGSKNLSDHFEKRVSDELTKQVKAGKKPDVTNIKVKTYVKGGNIITEASCDIIESTDGESYTHFTTRGSIGSGYDTRHDNQINGLTGRLEKLYGGKAKQVGDTLNITFLLNGQGITYRQSFFVCSDGGGTGQTGTLKTIKASNSDELRQKLKVETSGQMIDLSSVDIDMNKLEVTYKTGTTKVMNLSLIVDNKGDMAPRLEVIGQKNPTMKILKKGYIDQFEFALVAF